MPSTPSASECGRSDSTHPSARRGRASTVANSCQPNQPETISPGRIGRRDSRFRRPPARASSRRSRPAPNNCRVGDPAAHRGLDREELVADAEFALRGRRDRYVLAMAKLSACATPVGRETRTDLTIDHPRPIPIACARPFVVRGKAGDVIRRRQGRLHGADPLARAPDVTPGLGMPAAGNVDCRSLSASPASPDRGRWRGSRARGTKRWRR